MLPMGGSVMVKTDGVPMTVFESVLTDSGIAQICVGQCPLRSSPRPGFCEAVSCVSSLGPKLSLVYPPRAGDHVQVQLRSSKVVALEGVKVEYLPAIVGLAQGPVST